LYGSVIEFQMMADIFADPRWLAFYVLGLTAVSFHLGNGLRTFLLTWGGVVGDSARRRVGVACAVFGAFVLIFSLATVRAFLQ
jgi:succinate dehydrogenase / fumarate reductase cytochrome b subunit